MASYTTNYNLKKPDRVDFIAIQDLNDNADAIDAAIKANADIANAALPHSDFTGANILAELDTANSILPVINGGTGVSSLASFFNNKGEISSGNDADTYTITGFYQAAGGGTNLPSGVSTYGILMVINRAGYILQTYHSTTSGSMHFWKRISSTSGTSWSPWVQMSDTTNLATQIQALFTGGSISVVRQIIKGTVAMSGTSNVAVTVSLTNASKAQVEIDGNGGEPYLVSLTTTTLTLKNNVSASYTASYQIVEYY